MKIAVFYHCLFSLKGGPLIPKAYDIIKEQMARLAGYGLYTAASDIIVGVNGGEESFEVAKSILPEKSNVVFHGVDASSEIPTIALIEKYIKENPECYVLYFHAKGATHSVTPRPDHWSTDEGYEAFIGRWRNCMMLNLVDRWQQCVADLDQGYESAGCHWMVNVGVPPRDNIWGGNFWWATAKFLSTLPPIESLNTVERFDLRDRKRYEAEHWIGEGPRLPKVKDYHINGIGSCP